ncbi:flavin-containing monooxygenase [Nocardia blacklockiae]|uniref:flavin-containing monooxygenase n=1 Tax=Nocardia blacklockiae TaxID=480036 RepID=UPI00189421E4|nr:NAD(P)/FAD-dependent oxidoreductase [Nocardia blacklockiae]MBF6176811.1 NAD(P)/FAD-dependent oxidoreductase [Nocardia blacklockiae]
MDTQPQVCDVLIVGAGLSGVGAACEYTRRFPRRRVVVLEARDRVGGTWDLFRYPGVRSDSDMQTLGYAFRPWRGRDAIAAGAQIRDYIEDTAREAGVLGHIRFGHRVVEAAFCSATGRWTVEAETGTGTAASRRRFTCQILHVCTGYYRYDRGHVPDIAGLGTFAGPVVHPQTWPADFQARGRRIAVIGSGATAVTLVPALAEDAAHVTMVQRSPSYIMALPRRDVMTPLLAPLLGHRRAAGLTRRVNITLSTAVYRVSRAAPSLTRAVIRAANTRLLPAGYAVDTHLNPRYAPWDQRMCLAPDGDLFQALSDGRASVVTGDIDHVTTHEIVMTSGQRVPADAIVTATGLSLLALGGLTLRVDDHTVDLAQTVIFRGMFLTGVPNLVCTIGYTNLSWTLKAGLVTDHLCRLLTEMDRHGHTVFAVAPPGEGGTEPLLGFTANYVLRSVAQFPRAGHTWPWRLGEDYFRDARRLRRGRIRHPALRLYSPHTHPATAPAVAGHPQQPV